MTSTQYQELVEFLGHRFGEIDRQFTELRQEMLGHLDETYRRLERLEQRLSP